MKKHYFERKSLVGLTLLALTLCFGVSTAKAGTAANASIVNVVKVDYSDATGTTLYTQSATATVTVDLLAAAPTITNPTPASGQTADSGATQAYDFGMYANANGPDTYDFTLNNGTTSDSDFVAGTVDKYIASITDPAGNTTNYVSGTTAVNNIAIGATIITGDDDGYTVTIPAGTGTANNINDGDFVVINGIVYKVDTVTNGTIASYNAATNSRTSEVAGTITLFDAGGVTRPDFSGTDLTGFTLSEYYEVNIAATAAADSQATSDAMVYFNLLLTSVTDGTQSAAKDDTLTIFTRSQLSITKTADKANAQPGDTITYTITVAVTGSAATLVEVTDTVPQYTTLVDDGTNFATVDYDDGTTTTNVVVTLVNTNTENGTYASGDASGNAAGSTMSFYLGNGNDGSTGTGGTMAGGETTIITYMVTVD